jgi:hypothetical protein
VKYCVRLMTDRILLDEMKEKSRESAARRSWDAVFDSVYQAYRDVIAIDREVRRSAGGNGSR